MLSFLLFCLSCFNKVCVQIGIERNGEEGCNQRSEYQGGKRILFRSTKLRKETSRDGLPRYAREETRVSGRVGKEGSHGISGNEGQESAI